MRSSWVRPQKTLRWNYIGNHEEKFLPHHAQRVVFYRRFIDDVIGIWCLHDNHEQDTLEWDHFKNKMNAFPGLTWEFSERAKTIDFMDMTISINKSNCIETTLFEKRLNLHLYTHPPPLRSPARTTPWHCIRYSVLDLHAMLGQ